MEQYRKTSNKPKKYAKISLERRQKLIELIQQKHYSISKASRIVSIKLSTAKVILKKYREEGKFFQKRSERHKQINNHQIVDNQMRQTYHYSLNANQQNLIEWNQQYLENQWLLNNSTNLCFSYCQPSNFINQGIYDLWNQTNNKNIISHQFFYNF